MRLICHLKEDKTDTPVEEDETAEDSRGSQEHSRNRHRDRINLRRKRWEKE